MPETPERKVLKETLLKLKTRVIASQKAFFQVSIITSAKTEEALKESLDEILEMPEGKKKTDSLLVLTLVNTMNQNSNLLLTNMGYIVDTMNLYIETLEKYSQELDNTLTSIFEEARKMAEEQRKQQEELRKKEPSYRA